MPFTNVPKNSTSYTTVSKSTTLVAGSGTPLGLLLAITTAAIVSIGTTWSNVAKNP
jgi:hypothetical protein